MAKLIDLSVIHRDGEKLSMLPLLREFVKASGEYASDVALLSEKMVKYYSGIFKIGRPERGSDKDLRAVEALSDALYFMDCMVKAKNALAVDGMHKMLRAYYWERPYEAFEVVMRAAEESDNYKDSTSANILTYLGDLEMRTDKLEEAEKHYKEAESVYRRIHADLGLANALQAMGDLEQRKESFSQAIVLYEDAFNLYKKIMDNMGLAYTSAELCYCYAEVGNREKTLILAKQVDDICENLPYKDVIEYCLLKKESALDKLEEIN